MNFLGLDIGSSSIKGALLHLDEMSIGTTARRPCPERLPGPALHFEIDATAIVAAVSSVIDELLADVDDIEGIVSCSQMGGIVLVDGAGKSQSNYLSWRDQRLLEPYPSGPGTYYDVLREHITAEGSVQLGHECKVGSATSLLFWLRENGQLPVDTTPLIVADYVWRKLCDSEPVTEYTNALGAIDLNTRKWHTQVFERLRLGDVGWPRLCEPYDVVGEFKTSRGIVPCYPSVGDHQCALAGTLLQKNELSINVSTGSQISLVADSYQPGDYQVRPYFDGQYLNTLTHLPAGRSLNVLVDFLTEIAKSQNVDLTDPWPYIHQAVKEAHSELEVDLAFFAGPVGKRGSLRNITVENLNVGNLFLAAYQNMADNYDRCAGRLSPDRKWDRLVISGGLVQNSDVLREFVQERFNCPHRVCMSTEETFHGLLALALVASGRVTNLAAATDAMIASQ